MTLAQRAQAAADWLNAGERWRVNNFTADWPEFKDVGRWMRYRKPPQHEPMKIGNSDYLTHSQAIDLAIAEGWQESETQPVPKTGVETGQQGEDFATLNGVSNGNPPVMGTTASNDVRSCGV